jgi:hypothetical protein
MDQKLYYTCRSDDLGIELYQKITKHGSLDCWGMTKSCFFSLIIVFFAFRQLLTQQWHWMIWLSLWISWVWSCSDSKCLIVFVLAPSSTSLHSFDFHILYIRDFSLMIFQYLCIMYPRDYSTPLTTFWLISEIWLNFKILLCLYNIPDHPQICTIAQRKTKVVFLLLNLTFYPVHGPERHCHLSVNERFPG